MLTRPSQQSDARDPVGRVCCHEDYAAALGGVQAIKAEIAASELRRRALCARAR
jgi:hypothetical protein